MVDINDFVGLGSIPIIVALVELIKQMFPSLDKRFWPGIAIAWGLLINLALAYILVTDYRIAVVMGIIAGLSASGLYSGGKAAAGAS